jgi:PKD repeat protein
VAQKAIVLSEEDAVILQRIIDKVKRDTPAARQLAVDESNYLTPETYVAQAPAGGVPAASGSVLGQAECAILRSVDGTTYDTGLRKMVYNTGREVPDGSLVHLTRDKFGVWFVDSSVVGGGSLTVTGTAADGSVLFMQTDVTILRFMEYTGLDLGHGGSTGSGDVTAVISLVDANLDRWGVVNNDTVIPQAFGGMKAFRDGIQMWDPSTGYTSNLEFRVNLGTSAGVWEVGADRDATYCGLMYTPLGDRTYVRVPAYLDLEPQVELGSIGRVRAGTRFTVGRWEQDVDHPGWVGIDTSMVYKDDTGTVRTAEFVGGILVAMYLGTPTTTTPWPTTTGSATTTSGATTTGGGTTTDGSTTTAQASTTTTQPLTVTASATPTSGAPSLAVQFSCNPGGGNPASYSYSWTSTPPGGTIGSTQSFTYTYFDAGTYDVYVTVTDASSNTATSNHLTIEVTTTAAPTTTTTTQAAATTSAAMGPPTLTSCTPTTASKNGGTTVTIIGTKLTGTTTVKFGTFNAQSFTVNSATQITAVTPGLMNPGTYNITVTNSYGTSNALGFTMT